MTPTGVEPIGFPFVLKVLASWGLITMLISAAINAWQRLARGGMDALFDRLDPWEQARQNRRAAIIRHYPDADAG